MPPVALKKTQVTKTLGIPTGVKIYFQFGVSLSLSMDITCHSCGKATQLYQVKVPITKTIYIPKKFSGLKFVEKAVGAAIPGLNVLVLAQEIFETYQTIMTVKKEVEQIIALVKFVKKEFNLLRHGKFKQLAKDFLNAYAAKKGLKDDIDKLISIVKLIKGYTDCKKGKLQRALESEPLWPNNGTQSQWTFNGAESSFDSNEISSEMVEKWNAELAAVIRQKLHEARVQHQ
jgi:hypothetical protein